MTTEPNSVELFLHISGVIGMFVGYGALVLGTVAMRRARTTAELRTLAGVLTYGRRIGFEHVSILDAIVVGSVVLIGVTGIHMASYTGDWRSGWAEVAIVTLVMLAPIGPLVINPRLHAITRIANEAAPGDVAPHLRARLTDPILSGSLSGSFAVLIGLVFLMAVKPTVGWSALVIVMAVTVGVGWALTDRSGASDWWRRQVRSPDPSGDQGKD